VKYANKACALGFLLAEIRKHWPKYPCWCLDCESLGAWHIFRL